MSRTSLGRGIKAFRDRLNISQDKLAKKADIPFSTLAKIEAGYTPNPSVDTVKKIADALGVTIDELLDRK